MRNFLIVIILTLSLISCNSYITGVVHLENIQKETAFISRDTVQKLSEYIVNLKTDDVNKIDLDKCREFILKNSTHTDKHGNFKIKAKSNDTLKFSASGYYSQRHSVEDLKKEKHIYVKLAEIPCDIPQPKCIDTILRLHIIIAQKIKLKSIENQHCKGVIPFDSEYTAKYRIIENLYGDYKKDTITFTVYDHNGYPQFANYDTVLLYISEYCGNLVHVKYQFSDLYKTIDGRWASPLSPWEYENLKGNEVSNYVKINFDNSIRYSLTDLGRAVPKEYFETDNTNAIPIYGRYAEDIIAQMKDGKLKSFGFFK